MDPYRCSAQVQHVCSVVFQRGRSRFVPAPRALAQVPVPERFHIICLCVLRHLPVCIVFQGERRALAPAADTLVLATDSVAGVIYERLGAHGLSTPFFHSTYSSRVIGIFRVTRNPCRMRYAWSTGRPAIQVL